MHCYRFVLKYMRGTVRNISPRHARDRNKEWNKKYRLKYLILKKSKWQTNNKTHTHQSYNLIIYIYIDNHLYIFYKKLPISRGPRASRSSTLSLTLKVKVSLIVEFGDFKQTEYEL